MHYEDEIPFDPPRSQPPWIVTLSDGRSFRAHSTRVTSSGALMVMDRHDEVIAVYNQDRWSSAVLRSTPEGEHS